MSPLAPVPCPVAAQIIAAGRSGQVTDFRSNRIQVPNGCLAIANDVSAQSTTEPFREPGAGDPQRYLLQRVGMP